jgi:nucleoid-associated protein YgaU
MNRKIDKYALALLIAIGVWIIIYWLRPAVQFDNSPVLVTLDDRAPVQVDLGTGSEGGAEQPDETQRLMPEAEAEATPANAAPPAASEQTPPPARGSETLEYVVKKGDTLTGIAFTLYGRSRDWVLIFNANRLLLESPEDLRPGMRLIIPPALDPAGETKQ